MTAHSIVLDTNVIISAVLFGGTPREVLEMVIAGRLKAFVSPAMLAELREVLARPRFHMSGRQVERLVEEFRGLAREVEPAVQVAAVPSDPDDDRVLECAVAAGADFVVTGDNHLLDLDRFHGIRIVTSAQLLREVQAETAVSRPRRRSGRPRMLRRV